MLQRDQLENVTIAAAAVLVNIGQLLTLRLPQEAGPRRASDLKELGIIEDAAVLCLGGKIVSVGNDERCSARSLAQEESQEGHRDRLRGQGGAPGFCRFAHASGLRQPAPGGFRKAHRRRFLRRDCGCRRRDPVERGGGAQGRQRAALAAKVLTALREMAAHGTTTVEAKSGYGLTVESELKSLEAIREAASRWPGTVVATLLGAHVVPKEFQGCSQKYVEIVCKEMIPQAAKRKLAQFVDVFCDKGAFTPEETEQIFEAAEKHGLSVRAHMGQLSRDAFCSRSCVSIRRRSTTWTM